MNSDNALSDRRPEVLVVEDDRRLLAAICMRLELLGYHCRRCHNASEAIVQFSRGGVDLIISDLNMPGVDGFSVIGLIRSQSNVPIVVITGDTGRYRTLLQGFQNVTLIQKPFEMRDLVKRALALRPVTSDRVAS